MFWFELQLEFGLEGFVTIITVLITILGSLYSLYKFFYIRSGLLAYIHLCGFLTLGLWEWGHQIFVKPPTPENVWLSRK